MNIEDKLLSLQKKEKHIACSLFGSYGSNEKFMFVVKSITELVIVFLVLKMFTDDSKKLNGIMYFTFARQIYLFVEEFLYDK